MVYLALKKTDIEAVQKLNGRMTSARKTSDLIIIIHRYNVRERKEEGARAAEVALLMSKEKVVGVTKRG